MNGSVEHLGQANDHMRRSQNIMAWTTAIFGALLLSGLVWIANDIFHLKDQLIESERRFDGVDTQMTALGTRIDELNITIEQLGAQLLAARGSGGGGVSAPVTGPDVSVLSSPPAPDSFQTAANAPAEVVAPDAAAVPQQQAALTPVEPVAPVQPAAPAPAPVAPAAAPAAAPAPEASAAADVASFAPSPPAPREQLTPAELAEPAPVLAAAAPAAAPVAAAPAAAPAPAAAAPAPAAAAAPAAAPSGGDLSDDQLLSFNDDQIDPADELLLLDENGNPQ